MTLLFLLACAGDSDTDSDTDPLVVDCPFQDQQDWYADADGDGFGVEEGAVRACDAPLGMVAQAGDCLDSDAQVHPDAQEVCSGRDDDCDGLVDDLDDSIDTESVLSWADVDQDGYGDPEQAASGSCMPPEGYVDNNLDCDDSEPQTHPEAVEICDSQDNNCDGRVDEELGEQVCAAVSCASLMGSGQASGQYQVDPSGWGESGVFDPELADPFAAWCDMETDGGGWTLVGWTNDSEQLTETGLAGGVPYPGLAVCSELDCLRGSSASNAQLQALIQHAAQIGVGHSQAAFTGFLLLGQYDFAAAFDYGDLSQVRIPLESMELCDKNTALLGTTRVLTGPSDYQDAAVYLSLGLRYGSYAYAEGSNYIWNVADPEPCSGTGLAPSVYLGTWSSGEYGPYLSKAAGARSVWVR